MSISNVVAPEKYLVFRLHDAILGICTRYIQEIVGIRNAVRNRMDGPGGTLLGEIRGRRLPVVNLGARLGMNGDSYHSNASLVVVRSPNSNAGKLLGIVADDVFQVEEFSVKGAPKNGKSPPTLGVGDLNGIPVTVVDVDKLLNEESEPHAAGKRIESKRKQP